MVQFDLKTLGTFTIDRSGEIQLYQAPRLLNHDRKIGVLENWFDLNLGVQNYKHQPMISGQKSLMLFIEAIVREGSVLKKALKTDIVCTSSLMKSIIDENFTDNTFKKKVVINAVRHKGIIFLDQETTVLPEKDRRDIMFIYGRLRFELFMTLDENDKEQNTRRMYGKNEFTKSAFRSKISKGSKSINVFHVSDVDCVDKEGNFTDCRTRSMVCESWKYSHSLDWFTQSYLSGIKQIAVGFREQKKFITEIEIMPLSQIEEAGARYWNKENCMEYLFEVLEYFRSTLKSDGMAYQFNLTDATRQPIDAEDCHFVPEEFLEKYN